MFNNYHYDQLKNSHSSKEKGHCMKNDPTSDFLTNLDIHERDEMTCECGHVPYSLTRMFYRNLFPDVFRALTEVTQTIGCDETLHGNVKEKTCFHLRRPRRVKLWHAWMERHK
jgi:hypothetical protein